MQNGHNGDAGWIRSAHDRYEGSLIRYALRITGDAERARDVVQDTFLRLCRQPPEQIDGHLAEWLFRVCRNRAVDVRRKESRMTTTAAPELLENGTANSETVPAADARDSAGRARKLIADLPENQQEVLLLKFEHGLSYREIAGVTGHSVSYVGYLIHHGLKSLRRQLKTEEP